MNERIHQKLSLLRITISTSILVLMFLVSCGPQLKSVRILAINPVPHTSPFCYPNIDKLYESDDKIYLVSNWRQGDTSKKHLLQWKFYNPQGERIYLTEDNYTIINPNSYYWNRIYLSQEIKDRLKSGMCRLEFYLDDKLMKSQYVQYINTSIINHNINGAVILPFRYDPASHKRRKSTLNTVTNAIYGEVKRIVKKTVPPAVAEENVGAKFSHKWFNDQERVRSIKEVFSEDILITGSLELGEYESDPMKLEVFVYHSKTKVTKKFIHSTSGGKGKYYIIVADLIRGILFKEGFLEYLRTLEEQDGSV